MSRASTPCSYTYSPVNVFSSGDSEDESSEESQICKAANRATGRTRRRLLERFRRRIEQWSPNSGYDSGNSRHSGDEEERSRSRSPPGQSLSPGRQPINTGVLDREGRRQRVLDEFVDNNVGRRFFVDYTGHNVTDESCSSDSPKPTPEEALIVDESAHYRYDEAVEKTRSIIREVFSTSLRKGPYKRRIVHDVYGKEYSAAGFRLDHDKLSRLFGGNVLIISAHEDHYHIVHDCSYSNGTCRCKFAEYIRGTGNSDLGRRFSRRVIPTHEFTLEHWENLTKYFEKGTRSITHMDISGRTWIPSSEAGCVRFQRCAQRLEGSVVEARHISLDFLDKFACGPQGAATDAAPSTSSQADQVDGGSGQRGKGDKIIQFIQERPTAPVLNLFGTSLWLKSKWKFMDLNSVLIRNCVRIVNNFYNELSVGDLYRHFGNNVDPAFYIFNAPLGSVDSYYYSIQESVDVLNRLLLFQFCNRQYEVSLFLNTLLDVLNRRIPKKNTIFVLSPPNSGKNFFFDAVLHLLINYGQMGNFNRYQQFPLMDCVDRRVIMWNEPVLEATAVETLKMILGGDTVNAKVKYMPDAIVTRTPVIVLSNNDVFPNDLAFRSRMISYKWKSADFLKGYNKKPHPMSIFSLFDLYDVQYE